MADFDVVIAGAGLIGASLGCALAQEGNARIAVIDPALPDMQNHPSFDDRGITLSLSSRRILAALGLWDEGLRSHASPIRRIHVTDRGQPGCVRFNAGELGLEAFGYVVSARDLGQALMHKLRGTGRIEVIAPATVRSVQSARGRIEVGCAQGGTPLKLSARLLVAADGSNSAVRAMLGIPVEEKDYAQTAIVANVAVAKPEPETAHERFTEDGPLALLPLGGERHVMVLTVARQEAGRFMALPENELLRHLEARTGGRLGRFTRIGARRAYPLKLIQPGEQVRDRFVLLGDSAHAMHPNGAQGFNLCLRDMAELAGLLRRQLQAGGDPGDRELLERYLNARLPDQRWAIGFSDLLTRVFYNRDPVKIALRNAGMILLDLAPSLKRAFALRATGIRGRQPAMVRAALN